MHGQGLPQACKTCRTLLALKRPGCFYQVLTVICCSSLLQQFVFAIYAHGHLLRPQLQTAAGLVQNTATVLLLL